MNINNWHDEFTVLSFFKTKVDAAIAEAAGGAITGIDDITVAQCAMFARAHVELDAEQEFSLAGAVAVDGSMTSLPAIVLEIEDTTPTENSNLGFMTRGDIRIMCSVLVAKNSRLLSVYKREVVDIVKILRIVFASTNSRITIGHVAYSDFSFGAVPVSSAVMELVALANTTDYT